MKKFLVLVLSIIMTGQTITAQTITVNGKVIDAIKKTPLQGVKVMYQGSDEGVETDLNGKFNIDKVNPNSVLMFICDRYIVRLVDLSGNQKIFVELERDRKFLDISTDISYFFSLHYGPPRSVKETKMSEINKPWVLN
ncbi:MAG: carboxypeptidase-like regulatory domain-containing protein [Bacteroidales bacterium]|jgi:iron complex outermembrane receptor protein|nr:carboxypeptidase-like regulatory domain-containing protein [Bacteroidales bacterium]